jgi:hypothetical protein
VHITGKLGFSENACNRLNLAENKVIMIGRNEDDETDDALYMKISNKPEDDGFKINRAGRYFYINTKMLFDSLNIDYKSVTIIFDLLPVDIEEQTIYKMLKREVQKKTPR